MGPPWFVAALVLVLGACRADECESGESFCEDDRTRRHCEGERDGHAVTYVWRTTACSKFSDFNPVCVTRDDVPAQAVCATSAIRSPACASSDAYCTDGVSYKCVDGYAVGEQRCPAGCSTTSANCL